MREDQYQKLAELQEKLADACIDEADPELWPGAGKLSSKMTKEERGDRYWCKKNAAATLTLLNKVITLGTRPDLNPGQTPSPSDDEEDELDKSIAAAEKKAEGQLLKFQNRYAAKAANAN